MPSSRASYSQLRQRSLCSRPAASAQQGHAEMPPGPDPAGPRDGLGNVPTTPNMPSWGSVFCGHVPWEPARVPAPELLGFLYRGGWEGCCPARSPAHLPPPRVRPLCEPAALWLVSGAASAGGEARAPSRGLWRPLAATRRRAVPCRSVIHSQLSAGLTDTDFKPRGMMLEGQEVASVEGLSASR